MFKSLKIEFMKFKWREIGEVSFFFLKKAKAKTQTVLFVAQNLFIMSQSQIS